MRFRLLSLVIATAIVPPVLAWIWFERYAAFPLGIWFATGCFFAWVMWYEQDWAANR